MQGQPVVGRGMRIGLLGGSFDPPHAGHVHITLMALKRFGLDRIWWMVSPGNPLKENGPAPLDERMAACQALLDHPRVIVTDIEAQLGTFQTADTLRHLQELHPTARFVWLMGADNLVQFHQWADWQTIMDTMPVGVLARPDQQMAASYSVAARTYRRFRLANHQAGALPQRAAPVWTLVRSRMVDISSTELRMKRGRVR